MAHSSEEERCPDKTEVEGSLPSVPTKLGPIAQLVEQLTLISYALC